MEPVGKSKSVTRQEPVVRSIHGIDSAVRELTEFMAMRCLSVRIRVRQFEGT